MNKLIRLFRKIFSRLAAFYIAFVYRTSRVKIIGNLDQLNRVEAFIIGFWHGKSFCFFPLLKGSKINVLTTINARGDYLEHMLHYFEYYPIRIADDYTSGQELLRLRRIINHDHFNHLAIALDGPLGPIYQVKPFVFYTALFSKRRMIHFDFSCRYKIKLKRRWDQYLIPLPFNKIKIYISEPLEVTKADVQDEFRQLREKLKSQMMD